MSLENKILLAVSILFLLRGLYLWWRSPEVCQNCTAIIYSDYNDDYLKGKIEVHCFNCGFPREKLLNKIIRK